ncbi:MAG: transposase [Patescibacteria group bacterium]
MPGRTTPLVTGETYHVFNRGIDRRQTFISKNDHQRALQTISFYRFTNHPLRLSWFIKLSPKIQNQKLDILRAQKPLVKILAYCLMPNHFHLLLRQEEDAGISKYLSDLQNSYTRYFNTINERTGPLFMRQFKAVRIENENQLTHVSRYVHLNPYTGSVVKSLEEIEKYPWSSFGSYLDGNDQIVTSNSVLDIFRNGNQYKKFVLDNADYQRKLKDIEHLLLE